MAKVRRRVFPKAVLENAARAVAEELMAANPGYEVVPHVRGRKLGEGVRHLPGAVESDLEPFRRVREARAAKRRRDHE